VANNGKYNATLVQRVLQRIDGYLCLRSKYESTVTARQNEGVRHSERLGSCSQPSVRGLKKEEWPRTAGSLTRRRWFPARLLREQPE
jgi:hypothetical protein